MVKLDKDIKIKDVLDLQGVKTYKSKKTGEIKQRKFDSLINALKSVNVSVDDKISVLDDNAVLKKIGELEKPEDAFTKLTAIENSLRKVYDIEDAKTYPFARKLFGSGSVSRNLDIPGADQARRKKILNVPSVKNINKAIHQATLLLVKQEKFEEAALLQIKHHTGLRTADIYNLSTGGLALPGAEYGHVTKGSPKLIQISNKGVPINYQLPSMPNGIIQSLANKVNPKDDKNNVRLFSKSLNTLNENINSTVNKTFKRNDLKIFDERTGGEVKFTLGVLRKNVFTAILNENDLSSAKRVLGHSIAGDVSLSHYEVTRQDAEIPPQVKAAERFNSSYLADIGQSNPQKVFGKNYKFDKAFFSASPPVKFKTTNPVDEILEDITLDVDTKEVGIGQSIDKIEKDVDKSIKRVGAKIDELGQLQQKLDDITGKGKKQTPKFNEDMITEHKDKVNDLNKKSKGNLLLSTAIILGTGNKDAISQLFDDPTEIIKDVVIDTAATAALGATGGLALVESLRPSPAQAAERKGDERPATQEELMRPVEKEALEGVADDERAIQEQMNITQMGEDFRREAERKSQLTLEDQMQMLQQGR